MLYIYIPFIVIGIIIDFYSPVDLLYIAVEARDNSINITDLDTLLGILQYNFIRTILLCSSTILRFHPSASFCSITH
jgi:hypothetical protein